MRLIWQVADSKSKIVMLSKILGKNGAFTVSELGRLAGLPKATVSTIVVQWEKAGLVFAEFQGRNKIVRINQSFYLLPELKRIFKKSENFQEPFCKKLESATSLKSRKVKAVVVFGSRARENFDSNSDLDVLIVIEDKNDRIAGRIVEEFVEQTNLTKVRFSPNFFTVKEVIGRLNEKDTFIKNILGEGKIIKGLKFIEHLQATR